MRLHDRIDVRTSEWAKSKRENMRPIRVKDLTNSTGSKCVSSVADSKETKPKRFSPSTGNIESTQQKLFENRNKLSFTESETKRAELGWPKLLKNIEELGFTESSTKGNGPRVHLFIGDVAISGQTTACNESEEPEGKESGTSKTEPSQAELRRNTDSPRCKRSNTNNANPSQTKLRVNISSSSLA